MKILLIHNYYQDWGGEDSYFESLKELLEKNGHQVIAYTKDSKKIKNTLSKIKTGSAMFWNTNLEKELPVMIKKFQPDIAHFNNIYPLITPTAYKICKRFKIPIVQRIPNYKLVCPKGTLFRKGKICTLCINKNFFYPSIINKCYQNSFLASGILATSFFMHKFNKSFDYIDKFIFQNILIKNFHVKNTSIINEKTAVIPHFVGKINFLKKNVKKDYFLFVGRLSEEKGIINLLKVFSLLPKNKLVVIGDGPLRDEVASYSKYKNIIIKNFQHRNVVFEYMRNALFTIIPSSFYETGPLVLMESYANGTPVIVPRFWVFKEEVTNMKTGVFYKYNDFNDLKRKILLLSTNSKKNLIKKMSVNSKKRFEEKFTSEKHYSLLIKLYKEVLHQHI